MRALHVTLDQIIDACITLGISARRAAVIARDAGYRFDNNEFAEAYRAQKARREESAA